MRVEPGVDTGSAVRTVSVAILLSAAGPVLLASSIAGRLGTATTAASLAVAVVSISRTSVVRYGPRLVIVIAGGAAAGLLPSLDGGLTALFDPALAVWSGSLIAYVAWAVLHRPPVPGVRTDWHAGPASAVLVVAVSAMMAVREQSAGAAAIASTIWLVATAVALALGGPAHGLGGRVPSRWLAVSALPIAWVVRNDLVALVLVVLLLLGAAIPRRAVSARVWSAPVSIRRPGVAWATAVIGFWGIHAAASRGFAGAFREGLGRFDVGIYVKIAEFGYARGIDGGNLIGWFPGFPLVVRAVVGVTRNLELSVYLVAFAGGLAATLAFWKWSADRLAEPAAQSCALLVLLTYPFAFFLLGVPYSDGVFLALLIAAFSAVERDRLLLAGALCAAASLVRIVGVVGAVAMTVTALERHGVLAGRSPDAPRRLTTVLRIQRGEFRWRLLTPLLGVTGAIAFAVYCWLWLDDPFGYTRVNAATTLRTPVTDLDTWFKWNIMGQTELGLMLDDLRSRPLNFVASYGQMVVSLGVLALVPRIRRRLGLGYALQCLGVLVLIWNGPPQFAAAGRYLLAAFPAFAVVGEMLAGRSRRTQLAWFSVSATLLAGLSVCWAVPWVPGIW